MISLAILSKKCFRTFTRQKLFFLGGYRSFQLINVKNLIQTLIPQEQSALIAADSYGRFNYDIGFCIVIPCSSVTIFNYLLSIK
jgi:hypothetical protein